MRCNQKLVTALLIGTVSLFVVNSLTASEKKTKPVAKAKTSAATRSPSHKEGDPIEAIRQSSRAFVDAFNSENAKAVAAHWTEDGDYVDASGQTYAGRAAIEKQYSEFFKANDRAQLKVVIDSLRLLSDDAAIEDGRAMLDPAPQGAPAISKYTAVHVKVDGKWLMSTVRDTLIETPSAYQKVADLEWLIGTWTAEEHGNRVEAACRWVANKSFVERTHTVTHADHSTSSGVQLIGFNALTGKIQSWDFTSDGGHAVGIWTAHENGWRVEIRGVTADGAVTSAVNVLTRLDDQAYAWQSFQRTLGDAILPDSDEIVLRRKTEK